MLGYNFMIFMVKIILNIIFDTFGELNEWLFDIFGLSSGIFWNNRDHEREDVKNQK